MRHSFIQRHRVVDKSVGLGTEEPGFECLPGCGSLLGDVGPVTHFQPNLPDKSCEYKTEEINHFRSPLSYMDWAVIVTLQ